MSNLLRRHVHAGDIAMLHMKLAEARSYIARAEALLGVEPKDGASPASDGTMEASAALHMAAGVLQAAASVCDWATKNRLSRSPIDYEAGKPIDD